MLNKEERRKRKLEKMIKITNISDKDFEKLNYKEKQQYFRAKSKLCNVVFTSRDKNGKGMTYRKPKDVQDEKKN